jgi:hypothetical protein
MTNNQTSTSVIQKLVIDNSLIIGFLIIGY